MATVDDENFQAEPYEDGSAAIAIAAEEWRAKWPNHCKKCHGWGGKMWPATRHEPEDFDFCGAHLPDICHRCLHSGLTEDGEGPCSNCGWNFDDGEPML
jgi:hypothetical protein